jgi:hypothetical protein
MTQQPAENEHPLTLPAGISEGMAVHDRDEQPIGEVQLVYYGGASEAAIARTLRGAAVAGAGETGEANWGAFGDDKVPPELRARLLRHGYIRIEGAGITGVRRYVTAEQIADAIGNRVLLHASREELTRPGQ